MMELSTRINNRFQLSTDAYPGYREAVDRVFGDDIDDGHIHKEYSSMPAKDGEHRYGPPNMIRATLKRLIGEPKRRKISAGHDVALSLGTPAFLGTFQ
jgi:hypothetical protein